MHRRLTRERADGTPILECRCRSTSTAATNGHVRSRSCRRSPTTRDRVRGVRRAGRSACTTRSRSTSRAGFYNTDYGTRSATASERRRSDGAATQDDSGQDTKKESESSSSSSKSDTVTAESRSAAVEEVRSSSRARAPRAPSDRSPSPSGSASTSRRFSASETTSPAPPSGSVTPPEGLSTAGLGGRRRRHRAEQAEQRRAAHVGADRLRARSRRSTAARMNADGESSRRFIARRIFCWRRARVRSFSAGLHRSCACGRARAPACR